MRRIASAPLGIAIALLAAPAALAQSEPAKKPLLVPSSLGDDPKPAPPAAASEPEDPPALFNFDSLQVEITDGPSGMRKREMNLGGSDDSVYMRGTTQGLDTLNYRGKLTPEEVKTLQSIQDDFPTLVAGKPDSFDPNVYVLLNRVKPGTNPTTPAGARCGCDPAREQFVYSAGRQNGSDPSPADVAKRDAVIAALKKIADEVDARRQASIPPGISDTLAFNDNHGDKGAQREWLYVKPGANPPTYEFNGDSIGKRKQTGQLDPAVAAQIQDLVARAGLSNTSLNLYATNGVDDAATVDMSQFDPKTGMHPRREDPFLSTPEGQAKQQLESLLHDIVQAAIQADRDAQAKALADAKPEKGFTSSLGALTSGK